jgi:hypothetical protein
MRDTVFEKMAPGGALEFTTAGRRFVLQNSVTMDDLKEGDKMELYAPVLRNALANKNVYLAEHAHRLKIVHRAVCVPAGVDEILDGYITAEPRVFAKHQWKRTAALKRKACESSSLS